MSTTNYWRHHNTRHFFSKFEQVHDLFYSNFDRYNFIPVIFYFIKKTCCFCSLTVIYFCVKKKQTKMGKYIFTCMHRKLVKLGSGRDDGLSLVEVGLHVTL